MRFPGGGKDTPNAFPRASNEQVKVRDLLEILDEMDARLSDKQVFVETPDGWRCAA